MSRTVMFSAMFASMALMGLANSANALQPSNPKQTGCGGGGYLTDFGCTGTAGIPGGFGATLPPGSYIPRPTKIDPNTGRLPSQRCARC